MVIDVLTAALVVITAFYAWATYKMLKANESVVAAMQEQSISASRPYVVVGPMLETDNPIFYLRIANTGKSAALNLRLSIDKSFFQFGEPVPHKDIASFAVFTRPMDSFAPGGEIVLSLAQGFKVFQGDAESPDMPQSFLVTAQYEFQGRSVIETNIVDLRPYRGANVPQDGYVRKLGAIADGIAKLAKSSEVAASQVNTPK